MQARGAAVLWLDPGMRKTSIILHAFDALRTSGAAKKMLVVAPKRVCELVWRQETEKWTDFRHLRVRFLHGPKKAQILAEDADIYLINPEGVVWLAKQYANRGDAWPFDTVVFDEITKFKNSQAERSKALRGKAMQAPNLLRSARRRWGMTGTPNPNGYLDLFGQFLLLDDGAALGRFITHYRDAYFSVGWDGFEYTLQPGAERRVQERLAPYVFALNAADYITLPELIDDVIEIELEPEARAAYDDMRRDMVARLEDSVVEAANAAATYTKLSQMAGGAVYLADGSVRVIHSAKLDAISDLIDELQGQQMLIGYEFEHEKARLKVRFGDRLAFLSDARTAAAAEKMQTDWNTGRIRLMACHPASAGHGLNLQEGSACHLCWFGPIWDLELWEQFIRRLRRSGNTASHIIRHILVVRNSIDELKLQALAEKDTSQSRLKLALATALAGVETNPRSQDMVMKLQRAGATAPAETAERKVPSGWGAPRAPVEPAEAAAPQERKTPSGWGAPATPVSDLAAQRAEIQEKLNPQNETAVLRETVSADRAFAEPASMFSQEIAVLKGAVEADAVQLPTPEDTLPAPKTRGRGPAKVDSPPASGLSIEDIKIAVREELDLHWGGQSQSESGPKFSYDIGSAANAAKEAAEAVAALYAVNADAAAATYELLFGVIEKGLRDAGLMPD